MALHGRVRVLPRLREGAWVSVAGSSTVNGVVVAVLKEPEASGESDDEFVSSSEIFDSVGVTTDGIVGSKSGG